MTTASISEFLKCPICTETLVDPRTLPCGHSYCGPPRKCLDYIKLESDPASKCAVCSKVFQVKVSDLNPLYGIREAIEAFSLDNKVVERGQPCTHAELEFKMWCRDCSVALCVPCVDAYHSSHYLNSYKAVLKEQAEKILPELEGLDLQLYQISNEIKQLQLRQEEVEKRAKYKTTVRQIAAGNTVSQSPELLAFLNSKLTDVRQHWVDNFERKSFEFILAFKNVPLQFANLKEEYSLDYHVRDFQFRINIDIRKYDDKEWLSAYLKVLPIIPNEEPWKLKLEYRITILNTNVAKNVVHGYFPDVFGNGASSCGWKKFILYKYIISDQSGFIFEPTTIAVKTEIKDLTLL
ncbi:E3 ubiquitin-protein ligase TRIM32-like [Symsagittifera roscoffensis]|uniref:E3 ubiquitin-protein ligase TRIM32-like n=1 Tax=Symsagittifera roscoffensis TaxID=84072 RepID=UPI00307BA9B7